MGIPGLLQFLKPITKDTHISNLTGNRIAIDTYCWIHKAIYSCAFEIFISGSSESFYDFFCKRIEIFLQNEITLIMVFDGAPLPSKSHIEIKREKIRIAAHKKAFLDLKNGNLESASKNFAIALDVTPALANRLLKMFKEKYNLECIVAPYEADAQLAYLSRSGYVDYVLTEDSDLIAFGVTKALYKFDIIGNCKEIIYEDLDKITEIKAPLSKDNFLTACIISGCDYLEAIPRIGIKTAFKIILLETRISKIIKYLKNTNRFKIPNNYEENFEKAFLTFNYQLVYCPKDKKIITLNKFNIDDSKNRLRIYSKSMSKAEKLALKYGKIENCNFLGIPLKNKVALKIASGEIDPITHMIYDEIDFQCELEMKKKHTRKIDLGQTYRKSNHSFNDFTNITKFSNIIKDQNDKSEKGITLKRIKVTSYSQ